MSQYMYENKHIKCTHHTDKEIVTVYWTGESDLNEEIFKSIMLELAESLLPLKLKGILADTRKFNLTIPPNLQEWYNKTIIPKHLESGAKKMAFLISEDFFTQASIEQTMTEEFAQKEQETKYFDSYEGAEKWLTEA